MSIEMIMLSSIEALHEVVDQKKYKTLVDDMTTNGWVGRPVLLEPMGDGFKAWTGSHRLAAARQAGVQKVPAVIVDYDALVAAVGEPEDGQMLTSLATDDESKVDILKLAGLTDAAKLMQAEIDAEEDN